MLKRKSNKKAFWLACFSLIVSLSFSLYSQEYCDETPWSFPDLESLQQYYNYELSGIQICNPEDTQETDLSNGSRAFTSNNFLPLIINGKKYVAKFISERLVKVNAGPIENIKQITSVASGGSETTTTSTTVSTTIKISAQVNYSLIAKILIFQAGIDITKVHSTTIAKGKTYNFPPQCLGKTNSSIYYLCNSYDKYEITLQIAPVEEQTPGAIAMCKADCADEYKFGSQDYKACVNSCSQYAAKPNFNKLSDYKMVLLKPIFLEYSRCTNVN